ncbi:MAG: hypothetical protein QXR31_04830, partial [Zestosphaera sp.]
YMRAFEPKPDVAIELPTGTGKTMVGLLLAEWRRRRYGKPVIYACPTNQLAYQVAAVAQREGIQAVTLLGSSIKWDAVQHTRYEAAEGQVSAIRTLTWRCRGSLRYTRMAI